MHVLHFRNDDLTLEPDIVLESSDGLLIDDLIPEKFANFTRTFVLCLSVCIPVHH